MRSSWISPVGPRSHDRCPSKTEEKTQRRRVCENRDWSDVVTSQGGQGLPEATRSRTRRKDPPLGLQRARPAKTLISDFWPPDCARMNFHCFMLPSLW